MHGQEQLPEFVGVVRGVLLGGLLLALAGLAWFTVPDIRAGWQASASARAQIGDAP